MSKLPLERRRLKARLELLLQTVDRAAYFAGDPISVPRRFEADEDRELMGLVAALLAFGNASVAIRSANDIARRLGDGPAKQVASLSLTQLRRRLDGFSHRLYIGDDLASLLHNASALRQEHGSLGEFFSAACGDSRKPNLHEGLTTFSDALRDGRKGRGMGHLVADPRKRSTCKRSLLYLRWMCRDDDIDLGMWSFPKRHLLLPVDTHVHRIGTNLGLITRKSPNWKMSEDVTAILRTFDAGDPVKYDFALCHLGVSRACPSRRDEERCRACVLRSVCSQWTESAS